MAHVATTDQTPRLSDSAQQKLITCSHKVLCKTAGAPFHLVTEEASSIRVTRA